MLGLKIKRLYTHAISWLSKAALSNLSLDYMKEVMKLYIEHFCRIYYHFWPMIGRAIKHSLLQWMPFIELPKEANNALAIYRIISFCNRCANIF